MLLEVVVPESTAMQIQPVAEIGVSYANMETKTTDRLGSAISVQFDESATIVEEQTDPKVMTECVLQIANERNVQAVALRDQGKMKQAKELLESNAAFLSNNAQKLESEMLQQRALDNVQQSESLDQDEWKRTRKGMRSQQHQDAQQQRQQTQPPK